MPLGMEVGLGSGDIVLEGDPGLPKGHSCPPNFRPRAPCGQTAGWIGIPLGTDVGLGQADIVLSPPRKGAQQPSPALFGPCLLWPS